jgi:arabinogalactan oligomer / maltooligosaccharide transport system permease protein
MGIRARRRLSLGFKVVVSVLVALYALLPVAFVVSSSLNPIQNIGASTLIPTRITMANYESLFNSPFHPWPQWILNSVIVSSLTAIIVVALCALAAYSFSRFRFRGRRAGLISLVIIQLFPNMLAVVALFLLLQSIGTALPSPTISIPGVGEFEPGRLGLNSLGGLILIYIGGALGFNTWLMKAYFDTVPYDLDESALVDGATSFQAFRFVVLPLVRPILAVIGILTFIFTYSDFLLARVMLTDTNNFTLAVGMSLFIRGQFSQQWGIFSAGAIIGALPIVITFLVLQRQLIGGLARGGVKG